LTTRYGFFRIKRLLQRETKFSLRIGEILVQAQGCDKSSKPHKSSAFSRARNRSRKIRSPDRISPSHAPPPSALRKGTLPLFAYTYLSLEFFCNFLTCR